MSSPAPLPFEIKRSAQRGELQKVVKWLRKGGLVDAVCASQTSDGLLTTSTLLHVAAANDHLAMVRELLKWGASVDLQTSLGYTALMNAAGYDHLSIVLVLLQHSADPDLQSNMGGTALLLAALGGQEACVKALLRAKANTELIDKGGHTAQQWADTRATLLPRSSSGSTQRRRSLPPPRLPPHDQTLVSPR